MRTERFSDRTEAGAALAAALGQYRDRKDVVVHGLPRGGVPVAFEVAETLDAPLDVMVVRKVGVPGHEELAMGAVASGGVTVHNTSVMRGVGADEATFERVAGLRRGDVEERERRFRGDRPAPPVEGRVVIVVDDGIATGSTMKAAVEGLRQRKPAKIVVAVPVAPRDVVRAMEEIADEVVCLRTPEPFMAVGAWYVDFRQTSDADVRMLLDKARA